MKMNEYGTSRAENSSKSISKQFPIDWDTSQTLKSNTKIKNPAPDVNFLDDWRFPVKTD